MDNEFDMSYVIIPRSDQINAEHFFTTGPITRTIAGVTIRRNGEQPVDIHLDGTELIYRPCKTMCKLLVMLWGRDARTYTGRSLTLFRDAKVTFGPNQVGGIRISHMSHIDGVKKVPLAESKKMRPLYIVQPLTAAAPPQADKTTEARKSTTVGAWITDTLTPALEGSTTIEALARVQASKQYGGAWQAANEDQRGTIQQMVAAALARIEAANEAPNEAA